MADKFTPTEQRIIDVLADGMPHGRDEIRNCLWDELSQETAFHRHVTTLRQKLNPMGYDVICENRHGYRWRLVRLLASPYTGN